MNKSELILDTCGCCEGVEKQTPIKINNDHGLTTIPYRVGKYVQFKESMLRGLSETAVLKELTIREDDDSTVALMDVWAMILDVLTFYNERIINEGYILTSTERLSLVELAKHISYNPKPGVAATSWFSFFTDESIGAPEEVNVAVGTRVQSIPAQDEKPQTFETIEQIQIKSRWNVILPKMEENQILTTNSNSLYLEGVDTLLNIGDYILIVNDARINDSSSELWDIRIIKTVSINNTTNTTLVTWQGGISHSNLLIQSDGNNNNARVFALRQRASIFGYNAPDFLNLSEKVQTSYNTHGNNDYNDSTKDWFKNRVIDTTNNTIYLDNVYPKIISDSWLCLIQMSNVELYKASQVEATSKKEFTLANKSNKIVLEGNNLSNFGFREALVLAQSEELQLAKAPVLGTVSGKVIELDKDYPELTIGQQLVVSGELAPEAITSPIQEINVSELGEIEAITSNCITLKVPLKNVYLRSTFTINANVAQSTHGESKTEILGSGNAAIPFQKFYLKQKPLTYISSASAKGIETTLEVKVDDIKWKEVTTFYNRTSEERIYICKIEDDGTTFIQFGNGITGSRLPSGVENIVASYRVGIGIEGMLKAHQLSMLLSPQLGIKSVTNPMPTTGAENPEPLEKIRHNAPLTVLTLDRIVSVSDYENFSAAFAGIGKARADLLWKGEDRTLHLTVASADESSIDDTLEKNLLTAIDKARHDNYSVLINSFEPIFFNVKSKIKIHPDYLLDKVVEQIKELLIKRYSFESRSFGQVVTPSEVISTIQSVEGVLAVDLDELRGQNPFAREHFRLNSNIAKWNGNVINPAELLLIDENNIDIILMTP